MLIELVNLIILDKNSIDDYNLLITAGVLHDVIEDSKTVGYDAINEIFGKKIADGVQALTKNYDLPEEERMLDSLKRIKQQPAEISLVKMADRIVNLRHPPSMWTSNKVRGYSKEALLIYNELKDASEFLSKRLFDKIEHYDVFYVKEGENE